LRRYVLLSDTTHARDRYSHGDRCAAARRIRHDSRTRHEAGANWNRSRSSRRIRNDSPNGLDAVWSRPNGCDNFRCDRGDAQRRCTARVLLAGPSSDEGRANCVASIRIDGLWSRVLGLWSLTLGLWSLALGLWSLALCLWPDCDLLRSRNKDPRPKTEDPSPKSQDPRPKTEAQRPA